MHAKATYVADSDFTLHLGDVRQVLAQLPAESVHCVVTSPPYWGLRDYDTGSWDGGDPDCDHTKGISDLGSSGLEGAKDTQGHRMEMYRDLCGKCGARRVDQQLGLEATPDLYVQNMVSVFREVRRVLRKDGTCWLNIGDSYATGTATPSKPSSNVDVGYWENADKLGRSRIDGRSFGLKPKDLVGIPWRLAFALQADGWYLRADIIWAKPNPMPESVTDRPTKAHEYLFLLTRSSRYFYDADAIREDYEPRQRSGMSGRGRDKMDADKMAKPGGAFRKYDPSGFSRLLQRQEETLGGLEGEAPRGPDGRRKTTVQAADGSIQHRDGERWPNAGRNRRSVWEIATEPYPDAHFATFPQALVEPCILAGTSEHGCCPECGAPWERETETSLAPATRPSPPNKGRVGDFLGERAAALTAAGWVPNREKTVTTTGWREPCNCRGAWGTTQPAPCTVLDPFMGSGTTALVARRLGRKSIGIELNPEYARLCAHRLRQLSLFAPVEPPQNPPLHRHRGLTGGAYSPPGQSPHSNARPGKT